MLEGWPLITGVHGSKKAVANFRNVALGEQWGMMYLVKMDLTFSSGSGRGERTVVKRVLARYRAQNT